MCAAPTTLLADLMRHEHASLALAATMQRGARAGAAVLRPVELPPQLRRGHSTVRRDDQALTRASAGCAEKNAPTIPSRFRSTTWARASPGRANSGLGRPHAGL